MKYSRIVIKVGTSTLAHPTGLLNIRLMEALVKVISDVKNMGCDVILVTSGSIGVGAGKLGYTKRPTDLPLKQACAAVGQCELMRTYGEMFSIYNHNVGQILVTQYILDGGERQINTANTIESLLGAKILPIVNENDTISTKEIEFGDNDTLSATVACVSNADLLLLLTDIDGLYDGNPNIDLSAKLIPHVTKIDDKLRKIASGRGSSLGVGGMITKLHAAEMAAEKNIPTMIIHGSHPNRIYDVIEGENPGTLFNL